MNELQKGILSLLKSAVTGKRETLPDAFTLDAAWDILSKQGLRPLAYQGAMNCGISPELPVMQKLLAIYYRHMIRSERQMRTLQCVLDSFGKNGIDHMPLKGCNLKGLYPKPELRAMGDADILIRVEQLSKCGEILKELGFQLKLESDHTDNWQSEDLYLELHKSLVSPEDEDYFGYYGTGWQLARKGQGSRYDLTPEDTFVFLITHFAHHYRISGIGCRHVLDLYVFRNAYPELDEDYMRQELQKLSLLRFYENILRLLSVWFEGAPSDSVTEWMTAYIFSGGNWGTMEMQLYAQEIKKVSKGGAVKGARIRSLVYVIFPPLRVIKNRYQILQRMPVLLPVMWVVRWFSVLLFSRDRMRGKLGVLQNMSDSAVLDRQEAMAAVGLEYR